MGFFKANFKNLYFLNPYLPSPYGRGKNKKGDKIELHPKKIKNVISSLSNH